ncbi:Thioredoxin-like fold [Dillenia turbinata]|uniref:protein-disulfide reductase n=1 Tax=Dillenia turbinata TaxID=194707 RepID=A0AAN8YTV3_9MAGN
MAGPDYSLDGRTHNRDLLSFLAYEGVKFLLSSHGEVPLSRMEGKTICLLFSANWCRPCRTFTPLLAQVYDTLKRNGKCLEILFVSFDKDENGFEEHFKCMPWLAIPFDMNLHRRLRDFYQIDRIPSLVPLGLDGRSIDEDAVGLIEDYGADSFPFTKKRKEELIALDNSKRQGRKLEELLAYDERNYVISRDNKKILVSELANKTIGLYFGANWCPPSRAFTAQLVETYNEILNYTKKDFEIIFISTDRDHEEFVQSLSSMPWLAIPYEDKTRQDLCRIFEIKGIPALVLIGPDGKTISREGRTMVSLYGAKAFPFTASRAEEIEAALKKEGDRLPHQVKDPKHEHLLKLDMAKAYVCDSCKKQGRFWAFSCDICDYDLHPTCIEYT